MKDLFFDIECADGGKATVCSFGYVIADMEFNIIRREDIVINPESRFALTDREGRPDVQLVYPIATFKRAPNFKHFYNKIKSLVENEEYDKSVGACPRRFCIPTYPTKSDKFIENLSKA